MEIDQGLGSLVIALSLNMVDCHQTALRGEVQTERAVRYHLTWRDHHHEYVLSPLTLSTVKKFVDTKKMPHLLFHGPPGTGKTSCKHISLIRKVSNHKLWIGIVAIAKHLYGADKYKNMILELNASDDRGINVVREQIKSFCSTQQLMSKGIKLVILDECDSMTSSAQFALRRSKV